MMFWFSFLLSLTSRLDILFRAWSLKGSCYWIEYMRWRVCCQGVFGVFEGFLTKNRLFKLKKGISLTITRKSDFEKSMFLICLFFSVYFTFDKKPSFSRNSSILYYYVFFLFYIINRGMGGVLVYKRWPESSVKHVSRLGNIHRLVYINLCIVLYGLCMR